MNIFIASFKYGKANLMKVKVIKETPKQYQVGEGENILGYQYIGKRVNKSDRVFIDCMEAMKWLANLGTDYVTQCRDRSEQAQIQSNRLNRIVSGAERF